MERIISDSVGLKVEQQLVALTDAAGNVIDPRSASDIYPISSSVKTYTNGLLTQQVDTSAAAGKSRTTTWTYTNGALTSVAIGNWV